MTSQLKVRGVYIDVDFTEELEPYLDQFDGIRYRGEKLQACSPFRNERHPSFAVNLENGTWVDSGADNEYMRKGNFISLLAYLSKTGIEEIESYLLDKHSHLLDDADGLMLKLDLSPQEITVFKQEDYKEHINTYSPYLNGRGVNKSIQEYFNVGQDMKAVALPWHDKNGHIINIKFRSLDTKNFWFAKNGDPIKNHVYGLFACKGLEDCNVVWLVESEIDCLYLWSLGIPAVAFGGASINERQKELLLGLGIERFVIATDNDKVGERFGRVLAEEFMGFKDCYRIVFPRGVKDVNEMTENELLNVEMNYIGLMVEYTK